MVSQRTYVFRATVEPIALGPEKDMSGQVMHILFVAKDVTLIVLVNIGRRLEPAANQSAN